MAETDRATVLEGSHEYARTHDSKNGKDGHSMAAERPPEQRTVDKPRLERAVREMLLAVGEDPEREGLRATPRRIAESYGFLFSGLREDPAEHLRVGFQEEYREMVLMRDIPFYSVCEHHFLPIVGKAHVGYVPDGRVVGLSKLAWVNRRLRSQAPTAGASDGPDRRRPLRGTRLAWLHCRDRGRAHVPYHAGRPEAGECDGDECCAGSLRHGRACPARDHDPYDIAQIDEATERWVFRDLPRKRPVNIGQNAKSALRETVLARRGAMDTGTRDALSLAIFEEIMHLGCYRSSDVVLAYVGFGSELQTETFLHRILDDGRVLLLPRVNRKERRLDLHEVENLDQDLEAGTWGIREPKPDLCRRVSPAAIDFALVPGVAFDPRGARLGYGGGYYDRLLAGCTELATLSGSRGLRATDGR